MRSNKNSLALSEQMADQICDRVSLPGAWWSLNENVVVARKAVRDLDLFVVGLLGKENVRRLLPRKAWRRLRHFGNRRVNSRDAQEPWRKVSPIAEVLQDVV